MLRLKDIGKQSDVSHVLLRSVSKRNCNVRTSSVAFTEELSVNIGYGNFFYSGGLLLLLSFFITPYTAAHKHTNTKKAKIHLKYDVKYKKDINTNNVSTLFAYTRRPRPLSSGAHCTPKFRTCTRPVPPKSKMRLMSKF